MFTFILVSALLSVSLANNPKDDAQYMNLEIKNVKGGGGSYVYRGGENINRFFNHTRHGYVQASQTNHEIGVCYTEVPTSTLVRDPKHIPAGNGSRPGMTSIRTCCHGYIRNIHNYLICDPVCTVECVNALCTAPEVCTCFPDHVRNTAGFCVPTCPIGCQNGHCNGQQCLCKEGFKMDVSGRFCVPYCRDNCGGIGNCTAPNTCECRPGYSSSPDGSCRPGGPSYSQAQHPGTPGVPRSLHTVPGSQQTVPGSQQSLACGSCVNGYCAGTECRCRPGYLLYRGECKALCNPNCELDKDCVAPNVCAPKGPGVNATQFHNNPQYPTQTPYQNPSQYPNGQYPQNQNQYPYPGQNPSNQHNQQYPNSANHTGQHQPNPIYAPYPGQQNQYPGQQNQYYPGQPNQYPQPSPSQPNGTNTGYPTQYPQPGHQHLYPQLPSNNPNNPQTNQGNNGTGLRTDGQVFYQTRPYNPFENVTFNLQGGSDQTSGHGQNATQGHYSGGQYGQGQLNQGQTSQGQFNHGQTNQGQYSQGQFGQGQYSQGQYSQGQYGQGQYSQGQNGHGHYQQGYYPYPGQQGTYGQNGENQQGQISSNGFGNCEQPCVNGNCVGQNRCECLPGYNQDPADSTGTRCVPYCHGGCLNGYCASPNNCVCSEGYHKDFSVKGRSGCVKRLRRSAEVAEPVNVADVLVFEIPDLE